MTGLRDRGPGRTSPGARTHLTERDPRPHPTVLQNTNIYWPLSPLFMLRHLLLPKHSSLSLYSRRYMSTSKKKSYYFFLHTRMIIQEIFHKNQWWDDTSFWLENVKTKKIVLSHFNPLTPNVIIPFSISELSLYCNSENPSTKFYTQT